MKSAFDLAMEKFGGVIKDLSEDKKAAIAEIESKYKAKLAEAELARDEKIAKAKWDFQAIEQIREDYSVEAASINSRREQAKAKIRNQQ